MVSSRLMKKGYLAIGVTIIGTLCLSILALSLSIPTLIVKLIAIALGGLSLVVGGYGFVGILIFGDPSGRISFFKVFFTFLLFFLGAILLAFHSYHLFKKCRTPDDDRRTTSIYPQEGTW